MYKNYIFDLYGTLVDIHTNENKAYLWSKMADIFACYGAYYTPKELKNNYRTYVKELENAICQPYPEIKLEQVFGKLLSSKNVVYTMEQVEHIAYTFRVISRDYLKLYPGVLKLLDALILKKKKIYLLSNAQRIFTKPEMQQLGIYDYFDGILYSSDAGIKKPQQSFMELLLSTYNLEISESIMIGNDEYADIGVANTVGMDSFYIHSNLSPDMSELVPATYTTLNGFSESILTTISS